MVMSEIASDAGATRRATRQTAVQNRHRVRVRCVRREATSSQSGRGATEQAEDTIADCGKPLFQVRRAKSTREPHSHSYIFCSVFRCFPPCRLTASTSHSFSALLGRSHCLGTCLDTLRAARTSVASLPPYQRMQIRQKNAVFMTVAASALRSRADATRP